MRDRPQKIAPHPFFFAFCPQFFLFPHPKQFLISYPNVQRTGGNSDNQHDCGGENAFFYKEVKGIIGIGKSKIHRENADDCRNDPVAISMGFQRNQKHAENKDHGNQRLRGKELLDQKVDGKCAQKDGD